MDRRARETSEPPPSSSWAYPLYDLALIGWTFGVMPMSAEIVLGREYVAGIVFGVLALITTAAVLVGGRDGVGVRVYFDSDFRRQARG